MAGKADKVIDLGNEANESGRLGMAHPRFAPAICLKYYQPAGQSAEIFKTRVLLFIIHFEPQLQAKIPRLSVSLTGAIPAGRENCAREGWAFYTR